jgi:hypothetical protein
MPTFSKGDVVVFKETEIYNITLFGAGPHTVLYQEGNLVYLPVKVWNGKRGFFYYRLEHYQPTKLIPLEEMM